MNDTLTHAPGTFCWFELATADQPAATDFYTQLFGWQHRDDPMGEDQYYTMLLNGGRDVGALYTLDEQQATANVRPHWMPYVAVEDADAAASVAAKSGGTVLVEPMDVYDLGRMAVLQDPTGAAFSVWQAGEHHGVALRGTPGSACWNELMTRDAKTAGSFYERLLGYESKTSEMDGFAYTIFNSGGQERAGMMEMTEEWGDAPSHWMTYFAVEDCDATTKRAEELGGNVRVPPTDIPEVGRFAVIVDPQGATFSVIASAVSGQ